LAAGPFTACPPTIGLTAITAWQIHHHFSDGINIQDGIQADKRIRRRENDNVGFFQLLRDLRRSLHVIGQDDLIDMRLPPFFHKPGLERQPPRARLDEGGRRLAAHGQHIWLNGKLAAEMAGNGRQRLPGRQQM